MFSGIFIYNCMVLKCMIVLFKPILALHIINFSSCLNYWGGGGGNDISPPPPPPRIDASDIKFVFEQGHPANIRQTN